MNAPKKSKSLQDILKQRQQTTFVGREPQIAMFRQNMGRSPELRDYFIFNVWGQGGVGKSTLLRQFRKIANEAEFATALTSDAETSIPEALGRLAIELEQGGQKLTQFSDRYKLYRQKKQELESDPEAPQGFSAFVGKSIAKAGLGLAKQVPGSGAVTPFIDEDAFTSQAGEWASYVAKKLGNKDDVQLVNEPVEVLTPLFVRELNQLAEKTTLVLFFDTYERTSPFLDPWLRELLDGRHGDLPANLLLVIAGRDELDKNHWVDSENFIARFPLNPFTDEEAIQYLHRKGITNDQIIETILHLSGRLPLLVTTLAATSPNDPSQIGDPSETAVERFLQWIDDPKRREVAIAAALPRLLNRDIIAVLQGEDTADDLFTWLKSMPFVEQRPDGWAYHDIARTQMLRYKRRTSPQSWADIHGKLAAYYATQRTNLHLDEKPQWTDATWQAQTLNGLYHQLCQAPQAQLPKALNEFLAALKAKRSFAEAWAEMMCRAGKDSDAAELSSWGKRLSDGLTAYNEKNYEPAIQTFTDLLNYERLESTWRPVAVNWRGYCYYRAEQYEQALQDLTEAINLSPDEAIYWEERGNTYRLMKRYEAALQDLSQAIELDPKYKWAITIRGVTYRLMERYEEALQDFNLAIDLDPKYSWVIANRGETYQSMERYEEALQDFNLAIDLDPKYSWVIANRGETYRLMDRNEEALNDFNRAIELDPKYKWAIASRGQVREALRQYEKALQDFDRAIEIDPNYTWAIRKRGQIYLMLGQNSEALMDFDRALELKPDIDWNWYSRALAYKGLHQPENAKSDFAKAIELAQQDYDKKPEDHQNTFNLAIYHLAAGNLDQSKHFYRDALNRRASAERIREAIRDLEDLLRVFPGHEAAQRFKQGLEKRVKG
jgi:tetratricopeptide (TPR) repeat protein